MPPTSLGGQGALSERQRTVYTVSACVCLLTLASLHLFSPVTLDHIGAVLMLPGLLPTLFLTFVAPLLTHHVIQSTKDAFLDKGFGGRDLLKQSSERIPESLGLPTSLVYCMLMFCFIPFRYGGLSRPEEVRNSLDGGWSGDMTGHLDFPHHEVSGCG